MASLKSHRTMAAQAAVGALLLTVLAAAPRADAATIYLCQKKKDGTVRIVGKRTKCKKGERKRALQSKERSGATGPTGPTGPVGGSGGEAIFFGALASTKQETGGWSASISAAKGAPQSQADGVVSLPIPLAKTATVKWIYRTAAQSEAPVLPCAGDPNTPNAAAGHACVYRGFAGIGSKEGEDKNVTDQPCTSAGGTLSTGCVFFEDAKGAVLEETSEAHAGGRITADVVFRTKQFDEAGGAPAEVTATSYLAAQGSWAVRSQ